LAACITSIIWRHDPSDKVFAPYKYRAKWEAAEAKLVELSQPLPATGTALVLYAPPKRKRGRPRKHPVAMAAE
jgi:hypothetical protein